MVDAAEALASLEPLPLSIVDGFSSEGLDDVVFANDERVPAEEAQVDAAEASASLEPLPLSIVEGISLASFVANTGTASIDHLVPMFVCCIRCQRRRLIYHLYGECC